MKILVFAFEPFGGERQNAGAEAVKRLPERIGGAEIFTRTLPVSFARAGNEALACMRLLEPDAALAVGQATGRACVTPERFAFNLDDARIPDNDGAQPRETPIVPGGPARYTASLPADELAAAIGSAGIPSAVSDSAGAFVCNHVLYCMLHGIKQSFPGMRGGFIHVPCLPEQADAGTPSMPAHQAALALTTALEALAACKALGSAVYPPISDTPVHD